MEIAARMSSKGQLTVPKAVRVALGIGEGDDVVFRLEGDRAVLARTPEFLSLAGTVAVPAAKRNVAWDDIIRATRARRAATRQIRQSQLSELRSRWVGHGVPTMLVLVRPEIRRPADRAVEHYRSTACVPRAQRLPGWVPREMSRPRRTPPRYPLEPVPLWPLPPDRRRP